MLKFTLIAITLLFFSCKKEISETIPKENQQNNSLNCKLLKQTYTYEKSNLTDSYSINFNNREFDKDGNLVKDIFQTNSYWVKEKKLYDLPMELYYQNGLLKKMYGNGIEGNDNKVYFKDSSTYEYNSLNLLIKKVSTSKINGTNTTTTLKYDNLKKPTLISSETKSLSTKSIINLKTYEFANGKLFKISTKNSSAESIYLITTNQFGMITKLDKGNNTYSLYEYDINNNLVKFEDYLSGNFVQKITYSYDSHPSKISSEVWFSGHPFPYFYISNIEQFLTYISKNNVLATKSYLINNGNEKLVSQTENQYSYDSDGKVLGYQYYLFDIQNNTKKLMGTYKNTYYCK